MPLGRHTTLGAGRASRTSTPPPTPSAPLVAAGATATELMVAPTLIAAAWNMPGTPEAWKELPPASAALLVEFRAETPTELDAPEARRRCEILRRARAADRARRALLPRAASEIEMLWRVREGMQGLLAAMRAARACTHDHRGRLRAARAGRRGRQGPPGAARRARLPARAWPATPRPATCTSSSPPNFGEAADLERYDAFMDELVELIVDKYDGSLKAEHGTGHQHGAVRGARVGRRRRPS